MYFWNLQPGIKGACKSKLGKLKIESNLGFVTTFALLHNKYYPYTYHFFLICL